jgi:deoxyribose-phosphate aldolase
MSLRVVDNTETHSPHKRNPGFPLDLDWVERIRMNRSALERRAGTIGARRTVK